MFFSIIIAIYNAEKTLYRCLDSIREQLFCDYEVILIDDGSTDNSFSICNQYSKQDIRFRTIHQENAGPSTARNLGLQIAKGKYICFVDSDDYISPDYLGKLYERAEKTRADLLFFGYYCVDQTGNVAMTCLPLVQDKKAETVVLLAELSEQNLFGYTWIKCFSKRVVDGIFFPEDMNLFEDEVFTCKTAKKAVNIEIIESPLYYYTLPGENTLTGKLHPDFCKLSNRVFQEWEELAGNNPMLKSVLEKKANYFVDRCRYYGFERNVECRAFFNDLAETEFFIIHTEWSLFDRSVKLRKWKHISAMRRRYRTKQFLAKVLHR